VLENQLKQLNLTQEQRLDTLIASVKHLQPHSSQKVEAALRELIISQKRIELDLDECSRHQSYPQYGYQDESYLPTYGGEVPEPQYSQPKPKQVDLEQVWSIKEPPKQGKLTFMVLDWFRNNKNFLVYRKVLRKLQGDCLCPIT